MKRILISIFLSFSSILVIICICRKINNKPYLSSYTILNEVNNSHIGYSIREDIKDLSESLSSLTETFTKGDIISTLVGIGKGIYYFGRFFVMLIVHVFTAIINIIILALRLCGFDDLHYVFNSLETGLSGRVVGSAVIG